MKKEIKLWHRNIIVRVINGVFDKFAFPVVYTDGLVSRTKKFREGRVPWGIVFKGCLVPLDFSRRMTAKEARAYCASIEFAGRGGNLPDFKWLERLNRKAPVFNEQCHELGVDGLCEDYYFSNQPNRGLGYDVVMMTGRKTEQIHYAAHEDRVRVLPVLPL